MKILISPAKKMNIERDNFPVLREPIFIKKTECLMHKIQSLSLEQKRELWKCNEKLLLLNHERFETMNLHAALTPAVFAYEGIQYQYLAPKIMDDVSLKYLENHLYILSGFYGVLGAFDGVVPYRLEMKSKLVGEVDLYKFWKDEIYKEVSSNDSLFLNLASKEYSMVMEPYLKEKDQFITCVFGEEQNGKVIQKGTFAKMARGEMVRFLATNQIKDFHGVKEFRGLGFFYSQELSTETEYIFLRDTNE